MNLKQALILSLHLEGVKPTYRRTTWAELKAEDERLRAARRLTSTHERRKQVTLEVLRRSGAKSSIEPTDGWR